MRPELKKGEKKWAHGFQGHQCSSDDEDFCQWQGCGEVGGVVRAEVIWNAEKYRRKPRTKHCRNHTTC